MTIKRRQVLQIAGFTWAAGPLGNLLADTAAESDLQLLVLKDGQALPVFAAGDLLLADTRETRYSGDGIYLYPHWGEPRPYHVGLVAYGQRQVLEFRNPGNQQLLWTQSIELDNRFAGKLKEHFSKPHVVSKTGTYPVLRLPALPPGGKTAGFGTTILEKV